MKPKCSMTSVDIFSEETLLSPLGLEGNLSVRRSSQTREKKNKYIHIYKRQILIFRHFKRHQNNHSTMNTISISTKLYSSTTRNKSFPSPSPIPHSASQTKATHHNAMCLGSEAYSPYIHIKYINKFIFFNEKPFRLFKLDLFCFFFSPSYLTMISRGK